MSEFLKLDVDVRRLVNRMEILIKDIHNVRTSKEDVAYKLKELGQNGEYLLTLTIDGR
jgi:hypothetical protein